MNLSDNCAISLTTMLRKEVIRLMPCRHFIHADCCGPLSVGNANFACRTRICRANVYESGQYRRARYATTTARDRVQIIECSNCGGDWKALAATLGVNYKTAYTWIRSGKPEGGIVSIGIARHAPWPIRLPFVLLQYVLLEFCAKL